MDINYKQVEIPQGPIQQLMSYFYKKIHAYVKEDAFIITYHDEPGGII